ncbi:hypothetical protein [Saccharothrix obliqua]|uniref:hypothetical protein n=1 Tax=Saccharothrix obliqua TaxID=2861747 RepID=UPI001C5F6DFD|nr:hypothetical protein [Saccharothrix obliqua]MBW4722376.1 hypothetical protein [Saccharothrix obliqua]
MPVEEQRREVEAALRELGLRMASLGVDAITKDKLPAVTRQVRALLDVLPPTPSTAGGAVVAPVRTALQAVVHAEPVTVPRQAERVEAPVATDVEPLVPDVSEVDVTLAEPDDDPAPDALFPEPGARPAAPASLVGGLSPTGEQTAIIEACAAGKDLVIEAGAGTGKTSTLRLAALQMPARRRGIYIAFNRSVANEAKKKFPRNVLCSTAHALAFGALGRQYRHRLDAPRLPAREVAKILRIAGDLEVTTS